MDLGQAVVREIDDEELAKPVEGRAVELDDLGVDDADGLELAEAELAKGVRTETDVAGALDLQVGDARAEALVVEELAAPVGGNYGVSRGFFLLLSGLGFLSDPFECVYFLVTIGNLFVSNKWITQMSCNEI